MASVPREMARWVFAHTRRTEQQHVLLAFEEGQAGQLAQLAFVDRGLEGEVELVQALVIRKVRPLGFQAHIPRVFSLALGFEHLFEEGEIRQIFR